MLTTSALYYPHTKIADKNLIKSSLLLWDQVEYITPSNNWTHERFESKVFNEAIDLIARPHFPTQSERKVAHNKIKSLVEEGLPEWFFLDVMKNIKNPQLYTFYPDKFSQETWELLERKVLAKFDRRNSDYSSSPYFGLIMMSLLADSCAGETKRKITDRTDAYAWLQKYSTNQLGGQYIKHMDISQVAPAYERLVTLSIKVINTDGISIKSLVAMRKRELNSSSPDYRKFRMNYLSKVDGYIRELSKFNKKSDFKEIERQFQKDMESDLQDLREELNLTKKQLLFSKEVGVAVLATVGALTTQVAGLTDLASSLSSIGVGALINTGYKQKAERRKIFRSNSMSWLYLANRRETQFDPRKIII
ncbi:hypothetical protein [Pinibacter aurantiacus]|uniref:Uncharacterized protein n=1 Tax=Pinibacter aurantiacus TaxID=2851599 RepID=A0A9E2S7U5_9BACT|nr:hypothetical protein [Pinibacter aurantiacus]MBV4356309.1 hypothetical protein [Pinibacter aurantiacus]